MWMSDSNVQPMEQRPQTPRPQNVRLPHTTHGTSTLNCLTPMSSPWNEDPKPSNSHVQPTLMSNPWNEGLKPSNSHIQPMAWRPQTGIWYPWNEGFKPSNSHIQYNPWNFQPCQMMTGSVPLHYITVHSSSVLTCTMHVWYGQSYKCAPSPTLPNDDRHDDAKHDLLAVKVLTSSGVSAMKSDGKWINNAHYLSHI